MDEDVSAKAPVTRLRRRLSVEQSEESKSPAPSTPTKKRAARSTKPQLDLIEENGPEKTPNKRATRKSIVRDVVEEEKPLTPSRRSARIRSSTSIMSDTPQNCDSPRAKRATRRNSQVGSDSETTATSTTPARTRRTRKDSATNIDKPADTTLITDVISEEPENEASKLSKTPENSKDKTMSPNSLRKSTCLQSKQEKRLSQNIGDESPIKETEIKTPQKEPTEEPREIKKDKTPGSDSETTATSTTPARTRRTRKDSATNIDKPADTTLITDVISEEPENEASKLSKTPENSKDKTMSPNSLRKSTRLQSKQEKRLSQNIGDESPIKETEIKTPQKEPTEEPREIKKDKTPGSTPKKQTKDKNNSMEKADLSLASHNLIEDSCKMPLKTSNAHNKSLSSLKVPQHNKRTRTRSCNTIAISPANDSYFLSDNESAKRKVTSKFNLNNNGETGAGDSILINTSIKKSKDISQLELNTQTSDSIIEQTHNIAKVTVEIKDALKTSDTQKLFETSPETVKRTQVYIEDTDSNTNAIDQKQSTEDQCVPVVPDVYGSQSNSPTSKQVDSTDISKHNTHNQSCEPMDIDETMPENVVLNDSDDKSLNVSSKVKDQKRNSLDIVDSGPNVSKRKLSISKSISEDAKQSAENINLSTTAINNSRKLSSAGNNTFNKTSTDSNYSARNSLISNSITAQSNKTADTDLNKSKNKSKRKSSLSNSLEDDANKSGNENKSTLVLSQLKGNESLIPANSKKDISLNVTDIEKNQKVLQNVYSTSTPLQDKITSKVMKQRLPINVSDIKTKQDKESDTSNLNKTQSSDKKSSDSDSDNELKDSSKLIIDEADEASSDYESGDSQDEEEMQYERENEIITKGETLTSEDDVSNDTDYEKDSFVVSSDAEDNELLDGSRDDLGMSDNELTMSAKSKKKYNERKAKEQKEASREIFRARHSAKDSKTGQGLDSKLLESDDESMKSKPKKTNRLRLNSSQDTSMISSANELIKTKKKKSKKLSESTVDSDADESITLKKKGVKRLSESDHDHFDEKEITIFETEGTEKDPLEKVKEEPITPYQSFVGENIEDVEVDENVSIIKGHQSRDPLQSTIAQEEDDDDDSDISSNPEITTDYTNLLNNLNNISRKEKKKDISLTIDRKSKEIKMDPIIDQLNLTLTKNKVQTNNQAQNNQEDSSDSIDIKLLFTDDSNDSEIQPKANVSKSAGGEDFIPLKRTEAKTNIHEDGDANLNKSANDSLSSKKKKKGKESLDKSLNISLKKNKEDVTEDEDKPNKSIHNISANQSLNTSSKRKKKNSISAINEKDDEPESSLNESSNKSLNTSKKKNKNSISISDEQTAEDPVLIIHDTTRNRKQKKNSFTQSEHSELQVSFNTSTSVKKSKKNSVSEPLNQSANTSNKSLEKKQEQDDDDLPQEISYKSTKNKSIEIKTDHLEVLNTSSNKKGKKESSIIFTSNKESFKAAAALYDSDERTENKSKKQLALHGDNNVDDNKRNEHTRKRKLSAKSSVESSKEVEELNVTNVSAVKHKKKKQKLVNTSDIVSVDDKIQASPKENRKRKERDGDTELKAPKVKKETTKQEVSRLPVDIISKLGDKPDKQNLEKKKAVVVSTSEFVVETAKVRKNKPSHYLEESIYLNHDTPEKNKDTRKIKKPKVLPFVPTATTSGFGFTTNFKVSVIPTEAKFEAKTTQSNFKNDYLQKKLKKFGTYELLKTQRKVKMSKF